MVHVSQCNVQISKNPKWSTATTLKIIKHVISVTVVPILIKFGPVMHIGPPNSVSY